MKNKFVIYISSFIVFIVFLFIVLVSYCDLNYIEAESKYNSKNPKDSHETLNTEVLKKIGYRVKVKRNLLSDLFLQNRDKCLFKCSTY